MNVFSIGKGNVCRQCHSQAAVLCGQYFWSLEREFLDKNVRHQEYWVKHLRSASISTNVLWTTPTESGIKELGLNEMVQEARSGNNAAFSPS